MLTSSIDAPASRDAMPLTADAPRPASGTTRAPRATRLTRADVFQAADAVLIARGLVPIDRVGGRLGRASPNTIQDHLETRWSKLGSPLRAWADPWP
jgi:hypothetical protein